MWDDWNLQGRQHRNTLDHPEIYDFVDVSQNTHTTGQRTWDNFLFVVNYLSVHPRPVNTTKVYGSDTGIFGSTQEGIERFWKHMLAGAASVRFHRPPSGLGLSDRAVASIRAAHKIISLVPLWMTVPANRLLSDREENEAYLAALPGKYYVIYFPAGGRVKLDLSEVQGILRGRWINIDTGAWGDTVTFQGGGIVDIAAPGKGNWVVAGRSTGW
jgi:hypothetical protein